MYDFVKAHFLIKPYYYEFKDSKISRGAQGSIRFGAYSRLFLTKKPQKAQTTWYNWRTTKDGIEPSAYAKHLLWNKAKQIEICVFIDWDFRILGHDDGMPKIAGARNKGYMKIPVRWDMFFREELTLRSATPFPQKSYIKPKYHKGPFKVRAYLDRTQTDPGHRKPHVTLKVDFEAEHQGPGWDIPYGQGEQFAVPSEKGLKYRFFFPLWLTGETTKPVPDPVPDPDPKPIPVPRNLRIAEVNFAFAKWGRGERSGNDPKEEKEVLRDLRRWHDKLMKQGPEVYNGLRDSKNFSLTLEGFCSEPGKKEFNKELSEKRIDTVDMVIRRLFKQANKNIESMMVIYHKPHGEKFSSRPGPDLDQQRVEIHILKDP